MNQILITPLTPAASGAYVKMTYPAFRHWLTGQPPPDGGFALGATQNGRPIGLVLAHADAAAGGTIIYSLFVAQEMRGRGVAQRLLRAAEEEALQRGSAALQLTYTDGLPTTAALEAVLARCGWGPPHTRGLICHADIGLLRAPWVASYQSLPRGVTLFPWCDLPATDREELLERTPPWFPVTVRPTDYDAGLEPLTSLGLRAAGRVVGWLITHRIAPDTLRYTCDWVDQALQPSGCLLALWVKVLQRQARAGIPYITGMIPAHLTSMHAFATTLLLPHLTGHAVSRRALKLLQPTRATEEPK